MSATHNTIIIVGNVGRDPDLRRLPGGEAVAGFSVATTERRRGQDGQLQDQTTWFRVSAFGKLGEICRDFVRRGSYVYIEGALSAQEYTDREGKARQSLEVRAREMRMLDKADDGRGREQGSSRGVTTTGSVDSRPAADDGDGGDDAPF